MCGSDVASAARTGTIDEFALASRSQASPASRIDRCRRAADRPARDDGGIEVARMHHRTKRRDVSPRRTWKRPGLAARPSNKRLSGSHDPDDVTLRIGEQRDRRLGSDLGERHDHATTAGGSLVEDALRIVGMDVERDVARATVLARTDPTGEAVVLAVHAVPARVVRVEAPAEHVLVELLQCGAVLAGDLDVDDLGSHRGPPSLVAAHHRPPRISTTNGPAPNRQRRTPERLGTSARDPPPRSG